MNTSISNRPTMLYKTPEGARTVMALYDDLLNHWFVPYETLMLPTRHGDTFVIASGDSLSPVMILLHGAGGNSSMWAGDVPDYSKHFRVYAVDLPGEAGKSTTNRPSWDSPAFAEWLEDVLNGLKIEQATFVGLSQGAWTALKFAVVHPHRVRHLVLMSPGGIIPDRKAFVFRAIGLTLLGKWGIKQLVRALFADQTVPDEAIARVVEIMQQFKPRIGILPIFSADELQRLTMPTLLIGGTQDIIRDMDKIAVRLHHLLPNLVVISIAGAGHALIHTTSYVMKFLEERT